MPHQRVLPGVLCKRRGILYFAGELARIIGADTLKDGNVRVSILLKPGFYIGSPIYRVSGLPCAPPDRTHPTR
jgi:hypothetical protein